VSSPRLRKVVAVVDEQVRQEDRVVDGELLAQHNKRNQIFIVFKSGGEEPLAIGITVSSIQDTFPTPQDYAY
jgi:hypothetical protein